MARFRKANPRQMACDLGIPIADLRYKATGINRMAFYLNLEAPNTDGTQSVICGNVPNRGYIPHLPAGVAVEVPVLVDTNCLRPTVVNAIPPRFIARVRINLNGQELTVAALLEENPDHNYHAAMRNPHTAAERNLRQIRTLVDDLIAAHRDWLPASSRRTKAA